MKKNFYKYLLIPCALILGLSGCTKEYYDEHYYVGSEIITRDYTVKAKDWTWNEVYNRYECLFENIPEIDDDLYKYGSIIGTVFVNEEDVDGYGYQVQKTLPFVQSYRDLAVPYTETISFDIQYEPRSFVTFYIQTSDGSPETPILGDYQFKVAFVRDSGL